MSIPFSSEAEAAVLGAILVDPTAFDKVINLTKDDFYDPANQTIYVAMQEMYEKAIPIDMVTVADLLKHQDLITKAGGFEYVMQLATEVSSTANVSYYAHIIKDKALQRKIISGAQSILALDYDSVVSGDVLLEQAKQHLDLDIVGQHDAIVPICDDTYSVLSEPKPPRLFYTGLESVDKRIKMSPGRFIAVTGQPNVGKGHPDGTPILCPSGWRNIETLKVGDEVFASDGSITTIGGIFPRGAQQCYNVVFNDRTNIVTDSEHLWNVQYKYDQVCKKTSKGHENKGYKTWETISTQDIVNRNHGIGVLKYKTIIPINKPLQYPRQDVALDPYLLGLLLGDGGFSGGSIVITSVDEEIIQYIQKSYSVGKSGISYRIHGLKPIIKKLNLYGRHSWDKFVPTEYLKNDVETRLAILRGLMDSDGDINVTGKAVCFSTSSEQLAQDVMFLVRSLGGKVVCTSRVPRFTYKGQTKHGRLSYRLFITIKTFCPFNLKKKASRYTMTVKRNNKVITEIQDAGIQKTTCISINHPSGLYIAKDFIVTHNTSLLLNFAHEATKQGQKVLFFSIEMPKIDMMRRLVSIRTRTPLEKVYSDDTLLADLYKEHNLFLDCSSEQSIENIFVVSKLIKPNVIFIDNFSLLTQLDSEDDKKFANRVCRRLVVLSHQLNACIFLIAHMNKEGYGSDKPSLKDIYGSVHIGANADAAICLTARDDKSSVDLTVTKNRYGYCGSSRLEFLENVTTFREAF